MAYYQIVLGHQHFFVINVPEYVFRWPDNMIKNGGSDAARYQGTLWVDIMDYDYDQHSTVMVDISGDLTIIQTNWELYSLSNTNI